MAADPNRAFPASQSEDPAMSIAAVVLMGSVALWLVEEVGTAGV
jgi:hypothetical protein